MKAHHISAEVNIHLRAKSHDKDLIDHAADLLGASRSQFMLACALKEARNVILEQTSLYVNNQAFNDILNWLDSPASKEQQDGINRLRATKSLWDQ
jgi:uncharacterized protein (DUF1778 family)